MDIFFLKDNNFCSTILVIALIERENKTRKSLESLLVKTDAVDSKTATSQSNVPTEITNIDTNICI